MSLQLLRDLFTLCFVFSLFSAALNQPTSMQEENVAIYRRNIVCRRVSTWYFLEKWTDISPFIAINRRFLSDISRGQRGQRKSDPQQCPSTRYSASPFCLGLRGFEPQTKRFRVHPLTTWAKLPFDTYYATVIYILKFII